MCSLYDDHLVQPGATAVVADEWPLVRLGIVQALRAAGVRVVAEEQKGEDAVREAAAAEATYLIVGSVRDAPIAELVRRSRSVEAPPPRVVVLLDHVGRADLAAIVGIGVEALLARSLRPEELLDALERVDRGERVVAPPFLPLLVGLLEPVEEDTAATEGLLTRKEIEVLARLAEGRSNREIADTLYVTQATVKTHLGHIYAKLSVTNRRDAVARAMALGLLG